MVDMAARLRKAGESASNIRRLMEAAAQSKTARSWDAICSAV